MAPDLAPASDQASAVDLPDESADREWAAPTTGLTLSDEGVGENARSAAFVMSDNSGPSAHPLMRADMTDLRAAGQAETRLKDMRLCR